MCKAYQSIIQVIKDRTDDKPENKAIDYYEAARIAYTESYYMQKYLDKMIKDVKEINKTFKPIWEFTYKISGEEKCVKLVNRDPDNLLVSWIPGERIQCEKHKGYRITWFDLIDLVCSFCTEKRSVIVGCIV
jgi:hypothetical protein